MISNVPKGWDVESLEGLSVDGITNGIFNNPKLVGSGYRHINVDQMYQGFEIDVKKLNRLNVDKKTFEKKKVKYGDVFFTRSSLVLDGIAKCNVNLSYANDLTFDDHLMRVRPDREKVYPLYLAEFCRSYFARRYFMRYAKHSTMTTIGQSDIGPLPVLLPPLKEQEKITELSLCWSEAISSIEKIIELKLKRKSELARGLLSGHFRLMGFDEEWGRSKLSDLARFTKGKGLPKSSISTSGENLCIHYGELFTVYGASINSVKSRTHFENGSVESQVNDVLMPTSDVTPNGLATASCILRDGVVLGGDIMVIRPDLNCLDGVFLAYLIRHRKKTVMKFVTGTTVYHIYAKDLGCMEIKYPNLAEQRAIVDLLHNSDIEIDLLRRKKLIYEEQKRGLMQQLLIGKKRVV